MDIDVSIALFRNQSILRWCRVVCEAILQPINKLYTSARGHYCGNEVPAYFGFMLKFLTMKVGK